MTWAIQSMLLHSVLATLSCLVIGYFCLRAWKKNLREKDSAREDFKKPLQDRLAFANEQLARVAKAVRLSEQRGRETDALYHVGREISKLLSRQDTLE